MSVTSKSIPTSVVSRKTRDMTFIERLTPKWGRDAAWWVEEEAANSAAWFVVSGVMAVIVFGIGLLMLFGDGYATIQGIRYFVRALGVDIRIDNMPPPEWWIIQVVLVIIQVFGKIIKGMRPLWLPSYIFNVLTTAVFISIAAANLTGAQLQLIGPWHPSDGAIACGVVGSILGHFLALGAEQVTVTSLCMFGSLFTALYKR
ncbi:MAG: hypothetical protein WCK70_06345 [Chloroflexales bacterium]